MQSTAEILSYWADFMVVQDLTERTVEERVRFIRHVESTTGLSVLELQRLDLIRYLGSDASWTNSTKVHYRSALHTFFTWLQDEGFRLDNPAAKLPKVKNRKRIPTPFTKDEIELILSSGAYRRTRMMVALHYYLGLRVSEIARVHGRDVNWTNRTLTTVGKGKKRVTLPLNAAMWELAQRMPRDGYWFPNWKANKLYAAGEGHVLGGSVSTVIAGAIKRAGIVGHRPHDLRASTATLQSRAGVDPFIVQKNMRHESMDTTTNYRLVDPDEQRDGFEALPVVEMPLRSQRRRRAGQAHQEPPMAA